jgi:hypothetical protein
LGYEIVLFWSHVEFCLVAANAKVLAAELPKHDERDSQVLYPASLKASNDLGMKVMMFTITTRAVFLLKLPSKLLARCKLHGTFS